MAWQTKNLIAMLPAIGITFFGYAMLSTYRDYQERNLPARNAGFDSLDDMEIAKKAGFTESAKWRDELKRRQSERDAQATRIATEQARIKAQDDAIKKAENAKFQTAVRAAIALRSMVKNPESFKLERVTRTPDGSLCFSYRATNSFNAIVPAEAMFSPMKTALSGSESFPMLWSKQCKGHGIEVEHVAYALTYYPLK